MEYISNFVYNNNTVAYAQSAEGRIVFTTPTTVYSESYITDHLGNVRATFRSNATGQVVLLQTNNYYPYGLRVNTSAYESTFPNEYFYQGKELDNENGLNLYNFHARLYDPVLGRWHTPDPVQQYVSPYMAMGNNPVNRVDPNGMEDTEHAFNRSMRQWQAMDDAIMRQRSKSFADQYPGANCGNIDWSAGYWGSIFNNGGKNLGGGGAGGGGGGARVNFFAYGGKLGTSDGGGILSDDFKAGTGLEIFDKNGNKLVKNGGQWGSWSTNSIVIKQLTSVTPSTLFSSTYGCTLIEVDKFTAVQNNEIGNITFEGVKVYRSEIGALKDHSAFAFPGIGIFVHPDDFDNIDLLRHEFGHILQYRKGWNYLKIARDSVKSASMGGKNGHRHMETWTEWSANRLSYDYFNQPKDWSDDFLLFPGSPRPGNFSPDSNSPSDFILNWMGP